MSEYRFSVYAKYQLGICLKFDGQIVIELAFIEIRIAVTKEAHGFNFFGLYSN